MLRELTVTTWSRLRRFDRFSELLLAGAFLCLFVGSGYAQGFPSQDTFNGSVTATLVSYGQRLDKLETALNWAAGALILQLGAHALQISTQLRKRRGASDDDEPRVRER